MKSMQVVDGQLQLTEMPDPNAENPLLGKMLNGTGMISPDNVVELAHQTWLKDPNTVQLIKNLNKFKQTYVQQLSTTAGDPSISEWTVRCFAYGIRTTDAVIEMITNTTKFLEQAKK